MKKIYNYAFRIVCVYILILSIFAVTTIEITVEKVEYHVVDNNKLKQLKSSVVADTFEQQESIEEEPAAVEVETTDAESANVADEIVKAVDTTSQVIEYNYVPTIDTTSFEVIQTTFGSLSHYGHDCYGCTSNKTASGYDISNGNIYYTDSTFGSVRIVAAGYEYPLGTVLRLTNVEENPIIAIVLDRGGAIGSGKKYMLDLLTENNNQANQLGVKYNVQIEVLRLGY